MKNFIFVVSRGFLDPFVTLTRIANMVCVRIQVHPGLPSATGQGERVKKQLLTS